MYASILSFFPGADTKIYFSKENHQCMSDMRKCKQNIWMTRQFQLLTSTLLPPWPTGQWQYTYGHHRRTTDGWWVGALIMIELSSNLSSWHCPNDDGMASSDKRGEKHFNKMNVHLMKKKDGTNTHTHVINVSSNGLNVFLLALLSESLKSRANLKSTSFGSLFRIKWWDDHNY